MILCPVAIAVGCRKCPVFAVCPVKSIIGDAPPAAVPVPPKAAAGKKAPVKAAKASKAGNASKPHGSGRKSKTRHKTRH